MMSKQYNVHSLSRSGSHAISYWIIHNIVDSLEELGGGVYVDKNRKLCYCNNYNHYSGPLKYNFPYDLFPVVVKSYEDMEFDRHASVIILRDFLNLLASRYKKYQKNICLENRYICDIIRLTQVWKQHTLCPQKTILYNEWIVSKKYRDDVSLKILGIENINDKTDYVSTIGGGSSFSDSLEQQEPIEYLTRYNQIILPKYMIDYILQDDELIQLNKQIFDIDFKKILC